MKHINHLLGKKAFNEEKRIQYKQDLMVIGWKFNFRKDVWKVMPKPKSFRKILHSLFVIIKLERKKVREKYPDEEIHGTLVDYSKAYNLVNQSVDTAKLCSSSTIGGVETNLILIYLQYLGVQMQEIGLLSLLGRLRICTI